MLDAYGQATYILCPKDFVEVFVNFVWGTGLAMNKPKHPVWGKSDMVFRCPLDIGTALGQIRRKHCPEIIYFSTTCTFCKTLGIHLALLGFGIKEFTPGIKINYQKMPIYCFLVTTKATARTFLLPGGITGLTHGSTSCPLQQASPAQVY